jgi:osmotically-inducible protein OsmY
MNKLQAIIFTILFCNLQGCIGGAIAGTSAASNIIYDERSVETMLHDQNIEHLAAESIKKQKLLEKTNISTSSLNHNILIYGEVATPEERTLAYRTIKNIPKVNKVYNQLKVSKNISAIDTGKDSWITSKVRLALFKAKQLHSAQVRVITENKTVYLMGILTKNQQGIATNSAKSVDGVLKVVTLFETSK